MLIFAVAALAVTGLSNALAGDSDQQAGLLARASSPRFPFDENTSQYCTFWYENDGSMPCTEALDLFSVSLEDFVRWVGGNGIFRLWLGSLKQLHALESFGNLYMRQLPRVSFFLYGG